MLRAICFDLDNTLVDRDRAFQECVHQRFSDPAVREELLRLDEHGHGDRAALQARWTRHAGAEMKWETIGTWIAERLEPDPDLLSGLRRLSAKVRLSVITNGGSATQRSKFHAAGLGIVIPLRHLWVSSEVGVAKPDPAIFHLASRGLGVKPEACLHVGDQAVHDGAGARAAGFRARCVDGPLTAAGLAALLREEAWP